MVEEVLYDRTYATRLENGLRIFVEEDPQSRSVSLATWVRVGSRDDPASSQGISHFIEHLAFKGTNRRAAVDISREIDSVGGSLNAGTGRESTVFYADVPAEGLDTAVDLVDDLVRNPAFESDKIELERTVVLDELRGHADDPEAVSFDRFFGRVWNDGHPLSRPVLGADDAIRTISQAQVAAHHRRHYRPDRMVIAACGAVDAPSLIRSLAARHDAPPSPSIADDPHAPPDFCGGRHHDTRPSGQTHIYVALPGSSAADPDRYPMEVLNVLLGDGTSSRLFRAIREDRGLAYSVGSTVMRYTDGGLWLVYAATSPSLAAEVLERLEHELELLSADGANDEEIVRAKARLRGLFILNMESNANRAMRIGTAAVLDREILSPSDVLARLDAVTPTDVAAAADRFLRLDSLHVTTVGPEA